MISLVIYLRLFSLPDVYKRQARPEISSELDEISAVKVNDLTAITANGSTYRYLSRAHGLDFFFNIIVIRFLSEL